MILNLLSNALKSTFDGEIRVRLRARGAGAELPVTDTGTGISAEDLPHIFDRFSRIENARRRSHEGSGIGLALVRELVEMHGGSIGVESALGKGTTFTVFVALRTDTLGARSILRGIGKSFRGGGICGRICAGGAELAAGTSIQPNGSSAHCRGS